MATQYISEILDGTYNADQKIGLFPPLGVRYLHLDFSVSNVFAGAPSVVPKVQFNVCGGSAKLILQGLALNSVQTYDLEIGLELTDSANEVAKHALMQNMYLFMDHANSDDITYTVAANWGY